MNTADRAPRLSILVGLAVDLIALLLVAANVDLIMRLLP